jgi:hypothetical protein
LGCALDAIDDEVKLGRHQRFAVGAARNAGPVLDQPHLVARHRAVDLGLRAGAQHNRHILGAGRRERALKTVGHCEKRQQHHHYERNGDYGR